MQVEGPRVRIEELRLSGFRAFENARLTLDDLTVLVGRNGAGKSTIVDALEFLREALSESLESALERRGGVLAVMHRYSRAKRRFGVAIRAQVTPDYIRSVADASGLRYDLVDPEAPAHLHYGFLIGIRQGGMGFLVEREVAKVTAGSTMVFHRDAREDEESEPPWARDVLALPHFARDSLAFRVVLDALRDSLRTYKLSPTAIRAEPLVGRPGSLNRDGGNVGDVLKRLGKEKNDLTWITKHLGAITPGIVGLQAGTAAGRRTVQFFQSVGAPTRNRFEIGDMSDGTLRALAILLALRQKPTPTLVCIDEIEGSVHPAALAVLLDAVAASTNRCQILLTSHSPEALNHEAVTARRVRVVDWSAGKSQVFRLSKGAEEISRPPGSVGELLRTNALFTEEEPERIEGDFFEAG